MPKGLPSWLNKAVFYQIYPPSFFDSNADGIGDLQGIMQKLDYIEDLGCNAIWINPCFESPFQDGGYDISDYYKIAQRYGTNKDMRKLMREAKKRKIHVVLDFVPAHTSIQHPWFQQSCQAKPNKYTNWYIWTDSIREKSPDSYQTVNGYAERDGNFITNFFYCQPALNYGFAKPDPNRPWQFPVNHPDIIELKKEILNVMRFWLNMGADGLRVDMPFSLVKGDEDWSETINFWKGVRQILDREYPDCVLISEWGSPSHAIKAGFHVDFLLQFHGEGYTSLFRSEEYQSNSFAESSYFHSAGRGNIKFFLDEYLAHMKKIKNKGLIALPSGNHDITRISCGRNAGELKLVFIFLLTMPGIPFIYYGDEIGMHYRHDLTSKEGGYKRTGSRTPMQWNAKENAGFSEAPQNNLYLPVDTSNETSNRLNVEDQLSDESSLLNTVKKVLKLRMENAALQTYGQFTPIYAEEGKYPFIYLRSSGKKKVLVALNPREKPASASFKLPQANTFMELKMVSGLRLKENKGVFSIKMKGFSYGILYC